MGQGVVRTIGRALSGGGCLAMGQPKHKTRLLITKMDYAKKSLGLLSPSSLSRCVSVSASMTQQLLSSPVPRARPYRICNWDRSIRKGLVAESLRDLLDKIRATLLMVGTISLVLDEDGTSVETEEFFQTLEEGTVFMVLGSGQTWRAAKGSPALDPLHHAGHRPCAARHLLLRAPAAGCYGGAERRGFISAEPPAPSLQENASVRSALASAWTLL
ncbi:lipid transferase CIDEC isoform X3 [Caretta caretta]|uniref:lipid transferase CIDEC isoform X3 n=1 Tax=Caretta caretta TaxID=8467 RepID=UPI003F4C7E52